MQSSIKRSILVALALLFLAYLVWFLPYVISTLVFMGFFAWAIIGILGFFFVSEKQKWFTRMVLVYLSLGILINATALSLDLQGKSRMYRVLEAVPPYSNNYQITAKTVKNLVIGIFTWPGYFLVSY